MALFDNYSIKPRLVLLDIALNPLDSNNVDGLSLINKAKALGDNTKIVILTGYKETAKLYKNDVALILEKVSKEKALTKSSFLEQLKTLIIPSCIE